MSDERLREVRMDSPIAIGIGYGAACNSTAKAQVIKLRLHRSQAGFDVAQAFAIGQLSKGHRQKLVATREASCSMVALITSYTFVEIVTRNKVHQLCEHQLASIHQPSPAIRKGRYDGSLSLAS